MQYTDAYSLNITSFIGPTIQSAPSKTCQFKPVSSLLKGGGGGIKKQRLFLCLKPRDILQYKYCHLMRKSAKLSAEESAGQGGQVSARGGVEQRSIRGVPQGSERLQRQVHGGHDRGVPAQSDERGEAARLLQGDAVRHSQMSRRFKQSAVSVYDVIDSLCLACSTSDLASSCKMGRKSKIQNMRCLNP